MELKLDQAGGGVWRVPVGSVIVTAAGVTKPVRPLGSGLVEVGFVSGSVEADLPLGLTESKTEACVSFSC